MRKLLTVISFFVALLLSSIAFETNATTTIDNNQEAVAESSLSAVDNVEESGCNWWSSVVEGFNNNLIKEKRYLLIINGFEVTLLLSFLSLFFGTLVGAIICYMNMSKNKILSAVAKVYIALMRGIPILVLLMIMFYVVFASTAASSIAIATITFALYSGAYLSEMFRTSIESIDNGQREAGIALGFSKIGTFVYIILPQAIKRVLPIFKGEAISLVKMTSIVGYIAVEDLTKAADIVRSRTFDAFFPLIFVAVIYFLLAWLFTRLLSLLETKEKTLC